MPPTTDETVTCHFFVQNGIDMYAASHSRYIGSHRSTVIDSRMSPEYARIQRFLFQLENTGTALDVSIAHLTFDIRRRGLHRFGFRFHNLMVWVKLVDVVYNAPAFLICVGMPHLSVEYDALAARIGRLSTDRPVELHSSWWCSGSVIHWLAANRVQANLTLALLGTSL